MPWSRVKIVLGGTFRGLRDILTALLRPVWGDNPLSKSLLVIWFLGGIFVWIKVIDGSRGPDLLITGLLMILGIMMALDLKKHIAPALNDWLLRFMCGYVFAAPFLYIFQISGDWGEADKIAFVCFGTFHIHHVYKAAFGSLFFWRLLHCKTKNQRVVWATKSYSLAIILWGIALFSLMDFRYFPGNSSLQLEFLLQGLVFASMAMVADSVEVDSRWFKILLGVVISVQLAIFSNGAVSAIDDFGQQIPPVFIFFDQIGCP